MSAIARVSLDPTAFQAGAKAVQDSLSSLGKKAATVGSSMSSSIGGGFAKIGVLAAGAVTGIAGLAAGFVTAGKAVSETYAAMSAGGELIDLQEQTGVSIEKLMQLQLAFEQAGLGASDVQPTISKLQRALVNAQTGSESAEKAFWALGLSASKLNEMSADEQILTVGNAIAKIENPTIKSAVAMELFGKSGARMLSFFAAGGLDEAAKAIGGQGEIMARYAGMFDEITDKLGLYHTKLRGFFVGAAAAIAPYLKMLADWFAGLDFSGLGIQVGDAVATMVEIIKGQNLGEFVKLSLQVGFAESVNFLADYLQATLATGKVLFADMGKGLLPILQALGEGFKGIATIFAATLKGALADALLSMRNLPGIGKQFAAASGKLESASFFEAGKGALLLEEAGASLQDATISAASGFGSSLLNASKVFADNFKELRGTPLIDVAAEKDRISQIITQGQTAREQTKLEALPPEKPIVKPAPDVGILNLLGGGAATRAQQVFGMFGSMGAGTVRGTFQALDPMVAQQKTSNALLMKIEANTSKQPVAIAPAYQR